MSYKGHERYGTTLGGCLSCFVFYFIFIYLILILLGLMIGGRNIDSTILQEYNSASFASEYELKP